MEGTVSISLNEYEKLRKAPRELTQILQDIFEKCKITTDKEYDWHRAKNYFYKNYVD